MSTILQDHIGKILATEILHCKKHHFAANRNIYLNQGNIEATQDIYLLQSE